MKTILKAALATMLLGTVAACGQSSPDNAADANGQHMMNNGMMHNGVMNDAMMDNSAAAEPLNAAKTAPPPAAADEPAAAKIAPVPPKAATKPAPKAKISPPAPAENPHGGHDMNEM